MIIAFANRASVTSGTSFHRMQPPNSGHFHSGLCFFVCISNRFLPLVYTLVVYISARTVRCSLKHIRSRSISILFLIELNYNKFPSITWLAVTVH